MRILHTADWHLGKALDGRSRLAEQARFLDDFVELVERERVDLVLIAGDVYDSVNPPAQAEQLFYDALKRMSGGGERLSLVIAGNHDNPDRLTAAGPLAKEHGILMAGLPKTIIPAGDYGRHKVVNCGEGFVEISIRGERAIILTVPYPSERRLNEVLYPEMAPDEERLQSYNERLRALFSELAENFREDTINLMVAHLFATGAEPGGSERGAQLGGTYLVSASCFPVAAQYIALGHIHRAQIVGGTQNRARYAGAPLPYHKDEAGQAGKKCFLIDVHAGTPAQVSEIPFKIYKPIERLRFACVEDALLYCAEHSGRASYLYLEIETPDYIREEDVRKMRALKEDILEITPIHTGEAPEESAVPMKDRDFESLFRDFFYQKNGTTPDDALVSLILDIAGREADAYAPDSFDDSGD